jgi:molybdopterin-binding protein
VNLITLKITKILENEGVHIVKFDKNGIELSMISLELSDKIAVGKKVEIGIKSSHIAIGKNPVGEVSYSNRLPLVVKNIEKGKLLSVLNCSFFDVDIEVIITTASLERMGIEVSQEVVGMFKASEVFIKEILDD